jgi:outer membrane putative beta-barrel porin/alpha-amylase
MNRTCQIRNLFFAALILFSAASAARGEEPKTPIDGIEDNSFLIEEAYNQEPGVVQHIFNAVYLRDTTRRGWAFGFTQEWPVFGQDHQFSYTIPSVRLREEGERVHGVGDILLNYRYQLLEEKDHVPAFAPRFSLILPTGNRNRGTGNGVVGYQWSLPFSKKLPPRVAVHANLGLTYLPGVRAPLDAGGLSSRRSLVSYNLGASGIFAFTSRVNAMLEWVGNFEESINGRGRKERDFIAMISPGIRAAVIDKEELQTVVGFAFPIGVTRAADNFGVLLYLSIEHKLF